MSLRTGATTGRTTSAWTQDRVLAEIDLGTHANQGMTAAAAAPGAVATGSPSAAATAVTTRSGTSQTAAPKRLSSRPAGGAVSATGA